MSKDQMRQTIALAPEEIAGAFIQLAKLSFLAEVEAAIVTNADPYARAYDCGRASALRDLHEELELIRESKSSYS